MSVGYFILSFNQFLGTSGGSHMGRIYLVPNGKSNYICGVGASHRGQGSLLKFRKAL
jgi:hypothetical protein